MSIRGLLVVLLLLGLAACAAPPITFTLKEYLGEDWTQERVSFPVTLPRGWDADALVVREPGGTILSAEFIPDALGSGNGEGQVCFIVDLPAKARQTWTLVPASAKPQTDLFVNDMPRSYYEFGNNHIAVRCPRGIWGLDASGEIPTPIQAIRIGGGPWVSGGKLVSAHKLIGAEGRWLYDSSVSLKYRMTYTFEGGKTYTITLEALAGQEVILIREESNLHDKAQFMEGVRPAGAPEGNYVMQGYSTRGREQGSYWTLGLDGADRIAWQPTGTVWGAKPADGEPWGTFPRPTAPGSFVVLNPSHGEWWMNCSQWAGVYAHNRQPFLGLLALNAGLWKTPHENAIVLENDAQGMPRAVLPINTGARAWALYASTKDAATAIPGEEPPGEEYPGRQYARPPHLATIKYGLLPLDTVKDWTLEFPDPKGTVFPHVFSQAAALPAIRTRIAETPALQQQVDRLKGPWAGYVASRDPNFPLYTMRRMYPRGLDNLYMATGDEEYAKAMTVLLLDHLHYYLHQTKAGVGVTGYRWSHSYGMFHLTTGVIPYWLKMADLALGSPSVTPEHKAEIRALMAFWGELFSSRDYAPPGYNHGNTDMVASWATTLGAIGCLLNGHPKAKAWAAIAVRDIDHALTRRWHLPDYTQDEWYGALTLEMCTWSAVMLKQAGFHDFFADPRFREGLDFYGKLLTPPDPRHGNAGSIVPFGNGQGPWNRSGMWAVAAAAVNKDDPAFAGRLMWYWQRAGQPGAFRIGDRNDFGWSTLGWIDPTIPAKNPEFASEWLTDWGILFRAGCGTPRETYMALQMGKPAGLGGYNAEGGFHLYAQGVPLSLIFGIRSYDVAMHKGSGNLTRQRWLANRPSFDNRNEQQGGTGTVVEWAPSFGADYACGEWTFTRLQAMVNPYPREGDDRLILSTPRWEPEGLEPNIAGPMKTVPPITWRRQVLFVKSPDPAGPNYFVIRDSAKTTVPWDWNVWCLASELRVQDNAASFTGKFGVDLDVVPLTPVPELVTGACGPTQSFAGDWRQQVYQGRLPGKDGEFAAVLFPRKHGEAAPTIAVIGHHGATIRLPDAVHLVGFANDGAVLVVDTKKQVTISMFASDGQMLYDDYSVWVSCEKPVTGSLTATFAEGAITGDAHGSQREVELTWENMAFTTLVLDGKPVEPTERDNGKVRFTIPAGDHSFVVK